jgi:hypothetical protein
MKERTEVYENIPKCPNDGLYTVVWAQSHSQPVQLGAVGR